jgi:hypothetical protein
MEGVMAEHSGGMSDERLEPSADVVAQRVGDEIVLVDLRTNRMYDLNRTAGRLWELLVARPSLSGVHAQLLQEFAVEPAELEREITATLAALRDAGLVRVVEPA